jgi:Transmembrane protein 33/Nucleoporin POM33
VDTLPGLKQPQWILWTIFYVTLPLRFYTNLLLFLALGVGVVKRHGIPKFNKAYLQRIILDENLQSIPYLGVVAMSGTANFILYMPLILQGYLEVAPLFKEILDRKPTALIISTNLVKGYILKGVQHRTQLHELKSDIEVYIGIYVIVAWFIGWTSILTIMMYWQIMRLRYMMSGAVQASFTRVNSKILAYLNHRMVPAIVRNLYLKVAGFLSGMVEAEMNQAANGGGAGAGGISGMLSKCSIF